MKHNTSIVLMAFAFSGCGGTNFGGSSEPRQTSTVASLSSADAFDGSIDIGVDYESEGDSGFNLVSNALSGFIADFIGGDACWGPQKQTAVAGTPDTIFKVRKGATGCSILFKSLSFKEGSTPTTLTNDKGLSSAAPMTAAGAVIFGGDTSTGHATLSVRIKSTFSTTVNNSKVILTGQLSKIVTTSQNSENQEITISAQGDVVAFPNIKFKPNSGPYRFINTVDATLICDTKDASTTSACKPTVQAQSGGVAAPQKLSQLSAAVVILKQNAAAHFPSSLTQISLDQVFKDGTMDGQAQGVANPNILVPATVTGDDAAFKAMLLPSMPTAGEVPVLVVRYYEMVGAEKVYAYKVFRLNFLQ